MPKSRGRIRKDTPLTRAKNAVRGAREPESALAKALGTTSPANQMRLLQWAEGVRFGYRIPMRSAFPEELPEIRRLPDEKSGYLDEVRLLTQRVLLHAEQMKLFIRERKEIDLAILRSDFPTAQQRLDFIESELGRSLWFLKLSIAVAALQYGLEAQKTLAEELARPRPRPTVTSVLKFVSQRNEDATSGIRYLARLKNVLERGSIQESAKVHYNFHLGYQVPETEDRQKWLLIHEAQVSLIDTYEAFVSCVLATETTKPGNLPKEVLDSLDSMSGLQDFRTEKIRFIYSRADDRRLQTRDLVPDLRLLTGIDSSASPFFSIDDPRSYWIEALLRIRSGSDAVPNQTIRDEWIRDLIAAIAQLTQAEDALNSVVKRSLNLDASVTNPFFLSLATDVLSSDSPFSGVLHYRAVLSSQYLDPWDLPHVPTTCRPRYLTALLSRYGTSAVVRFVAWMAGLQEAPAEFEIAPEFKSLATIYRSYEEGDFASVISESARLQESVLFETYAIRWRCESYLRASRPRDAIRYAADLLAVSPAYYTILPIGRLVDVKRWRELRGFTEEIGLSILLDLLFRRTGRAEVSSFRRYAIEDFLKSRELTRPSQLGVSPPGIKPETLVYFLSEVCVPEVMDLMTALPSSRSVQEERREICSLLTTLVPDRADRYREELTRITAELLRDEGVRLVDQSRVFVDKDGFARWAEQELKESFDRYKSLYQAHVGFDTTEFIIALRKFIEHQQPIPDEFLSAPKGEADKLLIDLISDARDNFLLSPTHGLDAFLSMRVRHGTLSGMLRGPLEQNHIINQRDSGGGRYQRDAYWSTELQGAPQGDIDAIDAAIMVFSEKFDAAVDDLRSRLQIRRKDRPSGMFEIPITTLQVYVVKSTLSRNVSLEDFVERCTELFWFGLSDSLHAVQSYISTTFRSRIGSLFVELDASLDGACMSARYRPLSEAIQRARTHVQAVMDSIRGWFEGTQIAKRAYPIEQAIDVALEVVRITYRNFLPQITRRIDTQKEVMIDSVTAIGDILFVALDNVYKHSGIAQGVEVTIAVSLRDDNSIELMVENETAQSIDRRAAAQRLRQVEERIQRGEFRTAAVSGEGGTGLMKLKSLVDAAGRRPDALTFGFTPAGTFKVTAIIRTFQGSHANLAH